MYRISDEQMISIMNRVNDVWEVPTDQSGFIEYVAATQRLLGSLNMLFSPDNYVSERNGDEF